MNYLTVVPKQLKKSHRKYSPLILRTNFEENIKRVKKDDRQQVCVIKMTLWDKIPRFEKIINIFPLYRFMNRDDGICLPHLSSKKIGPVIHNQFNISPAKNLEVLYQSSKIYPRESLDDHLFVQENNHRGYNKSNYKFGNTKDRHEMYLRTLSYGKIYLHHRLIDINNNELRLSRIEMRYIYCLIYERNVINNIQYIGLKKLFDEGYSLNLCGFHSSFVKFKMNEEIEVIRELKRIFNEPRESFKQELILLCLLLNFHPWRDIPENINEIYERLF